MYFSFFLGTCSTLRTPKQTLQPSWVCYIFLPPCFYRNAVETLSPALNHLFPSMSQIIPVVHKHTLNHSFPPEENMPKDIKHTFFCKSRCSLEVYTAKPAAHKKQRCFYQAGNVSGQQPLQTQRTQITTADTRSCRTSGQPRDAFEGFLDKNIRMQ